MILYASYFTTNISLYSLNVPYISQQIFHDIHQISFIFHNIYFITWWRHQMETFSRYWLFVWEIHRSLVNPPHQGLWRGALMFSLIRAWINGWVKNREASDLRRHHAHYDVIVMIFIKYALYFTTNIWSYQLSKLYVSQQLLHYIFIK